MYNYEVAITLYFCNGLSALPVVAPVTCHSILPLQS
jgi:hypothetical protein